MANVYKWLMRKRKGTNKERLNKMIDIMAKDNHVSKARIKLDMYFNILTRGIGYTDYFRGNYYNLTSKEKDTFVTTKSFYKLISYLNDDKYEIVLHDKILFNTIFKKYLKREFIDLRETSLEEFKTFLNSHKVVFAKDPVGYGGHGITKITVSKEKDLKKLYEKLLTQKQYLIEEEIVQSKEVNEINPNVVCSLRICTLYKDGKVYLVGNAFRINQDESEIIGCTNDLYFSLGKDGKIDSNVIDDYGKIYEEHPLTHKKFKEVKIPDVKEAFLMCQEAALKLPQVRYIGWDIAFTDNGPVMVEGNEYPGYGILQFYKLKNSKEGYLKVLGDILGDELKQIK